MNYKNSIGEILKITFQPLKISYDESENLYCVLSVSENKIQVHRLDRILDLWPGTEKVDAGDSSIIDSIAPQVWGNCFSEQPEHIKVKFYNEANVWEKVKTGSCLPHKGKTLRKRRLSVLRRYRLRYQQVPSLDLRIWKFCYRTGT